MERRDFLKAGAVAGGSLGLGTIGCGAVLEGMSAVPVPSVAELQALDVEGFLSRLDTSLGFIQSTSSLDSIVPRDVQQAARTDPRLERTDDVVRKTLRSMLLVGSFSDLPEVGRAHPGMQARMWSSMQEMDDAVLGMNRTLTALTPTERADIGRRLREDPTLGARALGALDDEAVKAGVTDRRRAHLQDVGKHACFRLRQSTSLFIDEYDDKVKKVAARDAGIEQFQRRLMAQMGEKAFWEYRARQMTLVQAWQQVPGIAQAYPPPGAAPAPMGAAPAQVGAAPPPTSAGPAGPAATGTASVPAYMTYPQFNEPGLDLDSEGRDKKKLRKGNILLGVGGAMLGVGAIVGLSSIAVLGTSNPVPGYFMITAAALLGVAGIVCLIVGGVIRARA